jgi:transposase InsO family protein
MDSNHQYGLPHHPNFYNRLRPHSSLDRMTPDEAYFMIAAWSSFR